PIPDYSGDTLMISDIALGLPDATTGWTRGATMLALLPTSQFPASAFDVYYELYNMPPGHGYAAEISVHAVHSAGTALPAAAPIRLRFDGAAPAEPGVALPESRRVQASLARGHYRLTVTVTDVVSGRFTSRSRTFRVRGWTEGMTLVTALPRRRMVSRGGAS